MLKRTKLSIIGSLIYFLYVASGGILALYMYSIINDGDAGLEAIGLAVIMIIGLFYAAASLLPLIFKFIDIFANKKIFTGFCIPFDVVFIIANAILSFTAIINYVNNDNSILSAIICLILLVISVIEIIITISSLKCSRYE